jgi:aryl-alcohol dehydrogenase-like predicted oxidoreductase
LEPLEETAAFFGRLLQEGKIRAIGVSNFSPEQMERFRQVAVFSLITIVGTFVSEMTLLPGLSA